MGEKKKGKKGKRTYVVGARLGSASALLATELAQGSHASSEALHLLKPAAATQLGLYPSSHGPLQPSTDAHRAHRCTPPAARLTCRMLSRTAADTSSHARRRERRNKERENKMRGRSWSAGHSAIRLPSQTGGPGLCMGLQRAR